MATNINWWRSSRTKFGTLGTKTFFVDWDFGHDDAKGDGTPEHPYATIGYGYGTIKANTGTAPSGCVVRGHGNESFVGDHVFTISGDYWGAAIYDGGGASQIIYCTMNNLIYINGGGNIDVDYSISPYANNIRAAFAGCGRASNAGNANDAYHVYGVASSPILIERSKMYRGCIGGITATGWNIYSKILCTPNAAGQSTCGVTFGGNELAANKRISNCTVYDLPLSVRATGKSAQTNALHAYRWLFGKVDFILEHNDYFYQCLFTSDCRMFYTDKTAGVDFTNKRLKIVPVKGGTSTPEFEFDSTDTDLQFDGNPTFGAMIVTGSDINNFYDALVALYAAGHITINPETYFLQNCIFTQETSAQVFNNPEHSDFTTKIDSAAKIDSVNYFGALAPALNIPIIGTGNSGSDGVAGCWDNRSIDGCVAVESGIIKLDMASLSESGRILSKIIVTDPSQIQYNGIFARLTRRVKRGWIASQLNPFGTKVEPNGSLQATLTSDTQYVLKGSNASFDDISYTPNQIIDTTNAESLVVQFETSEGYLMPIIDANIPDTLYCRCRSMVYARAQLGETLKPQIIYFNDGDEYIKFHDRVIVPKESFICDNAEQFYMCNAQGVVNSSATDYSIAVIFDDRETIPAGEERIGGETKWIPAGAWGEYFAMKNAGAITEETIPSLGSVPKSSGHYMCFTKNGGGGQINGYKSILNQTYIQFALFVTKVSEFDVDVEINS